MTNAQSTENIDTQGLLRSCWSQFREIAKSENRPELAERLEPEMKRFELGLFRIVVMGEIKKGKTSFINALLGAPDLLPVASDIATSVVYKVIYGPERKFKVFFQPDIDTGKRRDPLEIRQEEIADYGTENGNPHNTKRVDFIGVEEPNPLLKEGIALIDTPGVGGLFKAHRDISWRYAPNADAIFFVLDSVEAVMSRDEVAFLKELKDRLKKQVFFVQTKTDVVDSVQSASWRERNKEILEKEVGILKESIRYFPISSKLKNIADKSHNGQRLEKSGFLLLLDFIHRGLKAKKDEMLAAQVATMLALPMNEIYADLQSQQRMLQTKSNEEITAIRSEHEKDKAEFIRWEREEFQQEMKRFSEEYDGICQKCYNKIQIDYNFAGPLVSGFQNEITSMDVSRLQEFAQTYQQEWMAKACENMRDLLDNFQSNVQQLCLNTVGKMSRSTDKIAALSTDSKFGLDLPFDSPGYQPKTSNLENVCENRAMQAVKFASGPWARIGLGALVSLGSLTGHPAPATGGFLMIISGVNELVRGREAQSKQDQARGETQNRDLQMWLQQQLQKLANLTHIQISQYFNEQRAGVQKEIRALFDETVADAKRRLEQKVAETQHAIGRSREENAKLAEDVKLRATKVEHLLRQLKSLFPEKSRS